MKTALFVIANNGFQDIEFGTPKQILEENGVTIDIAAGQSGKCVGKFGLETEAQFALKNVSGDEYDAVVFIGGPGAANEYSGNQDYFRLAQEARLLAAICIAPSLLAPSGIFAEKKVTGWNRNDEQRAILEENGAQWVEKPVVIDGNIITANGPEAAAEFGEKILQLLNR